MSGNGNSVSSTCAICSDTATKLVRDHCHATGLSRDWLCRACNLGLGLFRDNASRLRAAADYVEAHAAAAPAIIMAMERDRLSAALQMLARLAAEVRAKQRPKPKHTPRLPVWRGPRSGRG